MREILSCDVLVIGGGPAGVTAALSAARGGADTILVTDRPVLGGNSSSEVRVWTRGSTGGGNLFAEEMGVWGELKLTNLYRNPTGNVLYWDDTLLDAVLAQEGLRLLLNTLVLDVNRKAATGSVKSVACRGLRTEKHFDITAKQFVDCTGDGFVATRAAVPYRVGREGRDVFGEDLAQRKTDRFAQGCSLLIQSHRLGRSVPYVAPSYVYSLEEIERLIGRGGRIVTADMGGSDCWWFEYGGQLDIIGDDQAIYMELRNIALGIWNYIKNSGKFDADDLDLAWIGSYPGRRASRRLIGDETLTQRDVVDNRRLADAVCYGGWFMDSHPSGGIQSEKDQCEQLPVRCYSIPLPCMFHSACDNLLFAGRNISSSYMAFTSARIMNTCAMTGQAAGTAAALCVRENMSARTLWDTKRPLLLSTLAANDALLARPVPSGLEKAATVTATSTQQPTSTQTDARLTLTEESYVTFPAAGGAATLWLEAAAPATLHVRVDVSPLPSRRCAPTGARQAFALAEGVNELVIPVPAQAGFVMVRIEEAPGVKLVGGRRLPGVQAGYTMEADLFFPRIALQNPIYAPANAINGYTRPWMDVHAWVSDGISAGGEALTLTWEKPATASQVTLYFDPDLSMELPSSHLAKWDPHHHFALRDGMPRMLVKAYQLVAHADGREHILVDVRDNCQRRLVHAFPATAIDALTLRVLETYGGDAVVYQVSVQ